MNPRIVYADIIGQEGTTTRQLFEAPPEGYLFVKRVKLSNRVAESASESWKLRWLKQRVNSVLPVNFWTSRMLGRRVRPPACAVLTYSESSVVFRDEPWVLWLEVATQLAGFSESSLRRCRRVIERALGSSHCRGIICHSHAALASLKRRLSVDSFEHKMEIMRPGWPMTAFHPSQKPEGSPVRILFVAGSTMGARFALKGGRESLEAFAALRERFPGLELVVRSDVEPGIRRRYQGMPGLRIISGLVPREELQQLYRESDIYWYPAHCLMSVSMLEAMNHGLPVITTNYYDNSEYVEDGVTGVVLPHHRALPPWDTSEIKVRRALARRDPELVRSLVAGTATLIGNPDLRQRMGRAGRALVEQKFSLAEKNRKLKDILDRALELQQFEAQTPALAGVETA